MTDHKIAGSDGGDEFTWFTMAQSMGRVEGKIDQLLTSQAAQKEIIDDHEGRIRHLERGQWKRLGTSSSLGALLGTFGLYVVQKVTGG